MTDSGSGQSDDRDRQPGDGVSPGDDYRPSASWETSRGSGWENTSPYESPWAAPGSSGTAASGASAADRAGEDGPWPTYPDPVQPSYQQPPPDPSGYGQPAVYPPPEQTGYPPQPAYGQQPVYGQQPAYGVNPYQQPAYGYVPPNHPQATTAMILGIVGLTLCPFVGIAGFVMGGRVRREIDAAPGQWSGRGLATAGWVLGIISIVYAALVLAYIVVIAVVAVASS
ncbi:MAG TPA: hypothetical protein VIT42_03645 [Microlunatus sp.]